MIDFNKINEVSIPKFNGGEGVTKANMFMDGKCKIMKSTLVKGSSIGQHIHSTSCEIAYVLSGEAKCILDGNEEIVKNGECHYCPKGSSHSISNNGEDDLVLIDIVPEQ